MQGAHVEVLFYLEAVLSFMLTAEHVAGVDNWGEPKRAPH